MMWLKEIRPKEKLFGTAIFAGVLVLLILFQVPCPFRYFFGIECPGCGLTRSVLSALRFDFSAAWSYHSMFWSVPVLYLYYWMDGKLFCRFFAAKWIDRGLIFLIFVGFAVNWIKKF